MAGRRMERVNEQLRRELAEIVRTRLRDPRVSSATVTSVEAAPDLTFARVFVQISSPDGERQACLDGLEAATAFVRKSLADALPLRHTPELRFVEDRTMDQARRIEELLSEVEIPPEDEMDQGSTSELGTPEPDTGSGDATAPH